MGMNEPERLTGCPASAPNCPTTPVSETSESMPRIAPPHRGIRRQLLRHRFEVFDSVLRQRT